MGGLAVLDDIRLVAPGPQTVAGGQAQRFGAAGMNDFNYWIVAHYPIGISISGPFFVRDAPNVLDPANYVLVVWKPTIGAVSYDVLRTATAEFPQGSGFFAVATGLTQTTARDQGQALTFYAPPAPPQSPATCRIHLNNRDYAQPTLQMPCSIAVTSIIFADGTQQSTAGGGGGGQNQTPWLSDINGAGFSLGSVGTLGIIGSANTILTPLNVTASPLGSLAQFRNNRPTSNASISIANDLGTAVLTLLVGGSQQSNPTTFQNQGIISVTQATQAILFCTNSTIERMRITSSGVGIGTIAPAYALDVAGDINVSGVYRINGVPIGGGGSQTPWTSNIDAANFSLNNCAGIGIGFGAPATNLYAINIEPSGTMSTGVQITGSGIFDALSQLNQNSAQWAGITLGSDSNRIINIRMNGSGRSPNTAQIIYSGVDLTFWNGNTAERARLTQAGALCIGATAPIVAGQVLCATVTSGFNTAGIQNTSPSGAATLSIFNDTFGSLTLGMSGTAVTGDRAGGAYIFTASKLLLQVGGAANQPCVWCHFAGANDNRIGVNKTVASGPPAYTVDVVGDVNITGNYLINGTVVALAAQLEIVPLMTRIRALEDEVNHLKPTGRRKHK